MNYRLQPVLRLTLLFILVVVVSGAILTYLSINNITNLKELTEKRILEEQQEVASMYSQTLQEEIETMAGRFQEPVTPVVQFIDSMKQFAATHNFVEQAFIIGPEGNFLYPNFTGIPDIHSNVSNTGRYNEDFNQGEEAEFFENNYQLAGEYYSSAFESVQSPMDSATALNAMARVAYKSGNMELAVNYYNELITAFSHLINEYGLPFANFALQQLTQIEDTSLAQEVLRMAGDCLGKMNKGEIPLTYQTSEVLGRLSDWLNIYSDRDDINLAVINGLITGINKQIDFVSAWHNEITAKILENDIGIQRNTIDSFEAIHYFSGSDPKLLLLNSDSIVSFGFLINGLLLFETLSEQNLQKGMEFDYSVSFPERYNNSYQQYLTYSELLNPYFGQQFIQVKLTDENILQNIVKRRSWIYGIALVLLLVAMFLGIYLIMHDISREKRLTSLRSDFISNVTHELKTPLTSIYMFTESLLLGRVKSSGIQEEYLSVILKESERLKRMINNILEFSKAENGNPEYHFVKTNLSYILDSAIKEMDYWLEKENFQVETKLDREIDRMVDPEKLKQAFVNLISNAIKYSDRKKRLDIRLYINDSNVHIDFEDQGIGIPDNEQARIFDKFYRVDPREGITGTGLGLTVVKEIVEAHHGSIEVESYSGNGSKFSIILYQEKLES